MASKDPDWLQHAIVNRDLAGYCSGCDKPGVRAEYRGTYCADRSPSYADVATGCEIDDS
jgi:hypothetical protein